MFHVLQKFEKHWQWLPHSLKPLLNNFISYQQAAIDDSVKATQISNTTLDQISAMNDKLGTVTTGIFDQFNKSTDDVIPDETIEELIANFTEVRETVNSLIPSPDKDTILEQIENIIGGLQAVNGKKTVKTQKFKRTFCKSVLSIDRRFIKIRNHTKS